MDWEKQAGLSKHDLNSSKVNIMSQVPSLFFAAVIPYLGPNT